MTNKKKSEHFSNSIGALKFLGVDIIKWALPFILYFTNVTTTFKVNKAEHQVQIPGSDVFVLLYFYRSTHFHWI